MEKEYFGSHVGKLEMEPAGPTVGPNNCVPCISCS